jgi:maltose alpha-D-glucosyltransferase/alpha-amylase
MERAIRTRKECPEFGWGRMQFLATGHPSVLAHACEWRGSVVVAVHNFSRAAVTVHLDFPFEVAETLDLYGRHLHQPTPGAAHVIDLDGYDYRWLRLRRAR